MSILMAITGTEIRGLRLLGLAFSLSLVAAAIASGKVELIVLHTGLATFHISRLARRHGRVGPTPVDA